MKKPRICVLGGSGFVGRHLCARLASGGFSVTVPTRYEDTARSIKMLPTVRAVVADIHNPEDLERCLERHDVVVNLVGILNEHGRKGDGFKAAHTDLIEKTLAAMARTGCRQLVQLSSLKAHPEAPSFYLQSKGRAETLIRDQNAVRWTILQPSVIFGAEDSFTNRFAALLKFPVMPLARPNARFAPVFVDDVVDALERAIVDPSLAGATLQLCGPKVYSLRELINTIRRIQGSRGVTIGLPDVIARLQARLMEFIPGKPFSMDNYRSLTLHSICDISGFDKLGVTPRSLESIAPIYLARAERNGRYSIYRRTAGRD